MPKRKQTNPVTGHDGELRMKQQFTDHNRQLGPHHFDNSASSVRETSSAFDFTSPDDFFRSFMAPFDDTEFFDEYWEKKPLYIPKRDKIKSVAKNIFSRDILERLVEQFDVHFLRDVCASRYRSGERENLNREDRVEISELKDLLDKEKATIQFHQPQRFQDILWKMMEQLETRFGCLFGANVYITPRESQGLAPHYDDVEVFILQLEGQKIWHLYEPPQELPRNYSKDLTTKEIGKPTHSRFLQPGDLLYFPRGTVHQAAVTRSCQHSTHITFSTYQHHTYSDYLSHGLPRMLGPAFESDVKYRTGLPVGLLSSRQNLDEQSKRILEDLINGLVKEVSNTQAQVLEDMRLNFISNRLPPYKEYVEVEEMDIRLPDSHLTHMRLNHPGHTCVVVDGPADQSLFIQEPKEEEGSDDEDEEENEEIVNNGYHGDDKKGVFHVYHSLNNERGTHMMSTSGSKPAGYVFPLRLLELFRRVEGARGQWVEVSSEDLQEDVDSDMIFGDLVEYKYGL